MDGHGPATLVCGAAGYDGQPRRLDHPFERDYLWSLAVIDSTHRHSPAPAAWALLVVLSPTASAAVEPCDPGLRHRDDDRSYQLRSGRCEGYYVEQVAVGQDRLELRGFVVAPSEVLDTKTSTRVRLTWSAPGATPRVRAYSLDRTFFYRMDGVATGARQDFEWPTDLLERFEGAGKKFGFVVRDVSSDDPVILPTRIGIGSSIDRYRVSLWPRVRFTEISYDLTQAGGAAVTPPKALTGFYPPEREVVFYVPPPAAAGDYLLTVRGGGQHPASISLRFRHRAGAP